MGIILTNDNEAFRPFRIGVPNLKPDEVEESKPKVKKLPADNTGATMTMAKNYMVQGGYEVRPNGMSKEESPMDICVDCLRGCIGDMLAFYAKAHAAHWNVMGQDFAQFHDLFGKIYKSAHESVDVFAEFLRAMGHTAPIALTQQAAMADISTSTANAPTPADLAKDLFQSNTYILDKLMSLYHKAEGAMQHGLSNYVAERMTAHQKFGWDLGASLNLPEFLKP